MLSSVSMRLRWHQPVMAKALSLSAQISDYLCFSVVIYL